MKNGYWMKTSSFHFTMTDREIISKQINVVNQQRKDNTVTAEDQGGLIDELLRLLGEEDEFVSGT